MSNTIQRATEQEVAGEMIPCPYSAKCGGCSYILMPYQQQLKRKQAYVQTKLGKFCKVKEIIGMDSPYRYRNKVSAAFRSIKGGEIISGIYQAKTHHLVKINDCLIEDERADKIILTIRGMLHSFKLKPYNEDEQTGLIRHVLVRVGKKSDEVMVVIVAASHILPSKNNFVKALLEKHPEITTIVLNVNDKQTNMVLGKRDIVLYGRGYIKDILGGYTFRISPRSFYQINSEQTEKLYSKAIELAGLKKSDTVLDAYCGIGTIGIFASEYAGKVVGVELNAEAVEDAKRNAAENNVKNIGFISADAGRYLSIAAKEGTRFDVVFIDPPRTGASEAFLEALVRTAPEKIVYISCEPETQAVDMAYLIKHGYIAKTAQPVDMFPFTVHVETIVLMSRGSP